MFSSFSGPTGHLSGVRFSLYSEEEIRKLSVKCVTNPQTFDHFSNPTYGGLYDPAFGPTDRDDLCSTCGQNNMYCPGHFGHIELKLPVYHPLFLKLLVTILRSTCFQCHKMNVEKGTKCLFQCQMKALDYGLLADTLDLETIANSAAVDVKGSSIILQDVVTNAVQKYLKESLKQIDDKKKVKKSCSGKNVTELRNKIIKEFLRDKLSYKAKKCIHCGSPRRNVRIEYNSKIYLKALSSRQASNWESVSRLSKSNPNTSAMPNEDLSNVGLEEEECSDDELTDKRPLPSQTQSSTAEVERTDIVKSVQQTYITPLEVQEHLHRVWEKEETLLDSLLGSYPSPTASKRKSSPQMFFLNVLPVPPSRFRPISVMGDKKFDNPQSANLTKVLEDCQVLKVCLDQIKQTRSNNDGEGTSDVASRSSSSTATTTSSTYDRIPGKSPEEKLQNTWVRLQNDVNCFIDSDLDKLSTNQANGIKQLLEKKEGLFRKHMMGKRVNFAARSVISPDPYINTDQIGVPEVFAKKLTYPQPVTPWNVKELRQAVINGPNVHPGANLVENEDGKKILLNATDPNQRQAIAKRLLTPSHSSLPLSQNKKVYRHLKDGDVLLLNRQPTLHKPSIMAHKARVLPGEKTIRLHYANCKAYNADFDGDEMNAHFPQNELARSEAYSIASTNFQYLIPKDGNPVSGLIQDHMVSGVSLTMRDRFFNKLDYQQLVFCALATITNRRFELLKPTILKPQELWTGKQVISTILINVIPAKCKRLNLHGKSKIAGKSWVTGTPRRSLANGMEIKANEMCESQVIIRDGELLCGVLDKAHYGSTPFSLVHCCYELYGGVVSSLLLSALARVFTSFLQMRGFTLGVEDIIVRKKPDERRRKIMKKGRRCGHEVATEALGLPEDTENEVLMERFQAAHHSRDDNDMKELDLKMKGKTDQVQDQINKQCIPSGLLKNFPQNNLQLMVQSGAKGSVVNCMQISCLLGQIELEGRRPPLMISGRSLPSFLPYDPSPRAGGFVDGRFLTGIRPQEYFFHCMAGREGLVDTAVKTSRSGYLQRCLIKHLEGLHVGYDLTVRDSDGSVVQFCYGEDGLDVLKTACLSQKQFPFMASNYKALITQLKPGAAVAQLDSSSAGKAQRKLDRWIRKNKQSPSEKRTRISSLSSLVKETTPDESSNSSKERNIWTVNKSFIDAWRSASPHLRERYARRRAPDPVLSKMSPACHVGAVSEKFHSSLMKYITTNPDNCLTDQPEEFATKLSAEKFQILMHLKALRSLAEPGEGVGLLAAQSIGEPSTQMTLNTFHFAGRGEMNVTLGIPRMREILMTASANIKTPTMEVPLRSGKKALKQAKKLKSKFAKVTLSQVLKHVEVCETLSSKQAGTRSRMYRIRFQFLPHDAYQGELFVTPESILIYMETIFFKKLTSAIARVIRAAQRASLLDTTHERISGQNESSEGAVNEKEDSLNSSSKYDEDDDNADLSEEEADADGDATGERNKKKREQHASYEAPDQDEEQINKNLIESEESDSDDEANTPSKLQDEDKADMAMEVASQSKETNPAHDKRITNVMLNNPNVASYCFDEGDQEWCEVKLRFPVTGSKVMLTTLMEKLATQSVIYETPGITRSFLVENKDKPSMFKTEGVNLKVMWNHPEVFEIEKLYTNDTHQVANTYGIEATGRVIATEIKNVFGAYGIEVDPRHLTLVADYMTFEGSIKAFNRIGIESNASPFQKMSFETTMHFLRGATISGDTEQLSSPSSRLVVGRVVGGGTGCFDLKIPLC
ncbi:DNA-directed RNA polymerase I subunit RPA1-like isoform X2 [Dendronephthya gigantea]|uniref:DNA-directed RNA polymerase I subunit RPA1-like isoform X2 n=1 Tax=Dendronephthya gigantea TaxID=151771 RepID=UPI00106CE1BF|nr:DNA-directed RNA polymerase I subunit RPA1-like isoform X2 [Dendronephthya gigantea]